MSLNDWWSEKGETLTELVVLFLAILFMVGVIVFIIILELAFWFTGIWAILFVMGTSAPWWVILILAIFFSILLEGVLKKLERKDPPSDIKVSVGGSDYDFS